MDAFNQPPIGAFEQTAQHAVDIAVLQTRVKALEEDIDELKVLVRDLTKEVRAVGATLTEARGGWRVLMLVGGAAASVGAALSWILDHAPFGKG